MKQNNIHVIGVPEEEDKEKGQKVYLNKLYLRISLIWGKKQASKSKRHRELSSKSIKIGQHQNIS